MGSILGFLGGCGMLALIIALLLTFLKQMGWIRPGTVELLGRSAVMTCVPGVLYFALALLYKLSIYGSIEETLQLNILFRGSYMNGMYVALNNPGGVDPVSLIFAWISYLMGGLLFGQRILCGVCLAWGMTIASLFLIQAHIQKYADNRMARDAAFLLMCLPGSVFFLLPGFAPLCLLICAICFYFAGKRIHILKFRFSSIGYGWIISVCAILSSAVTICAADGRIG